MHKFIKNRIRELQERNRMRNENFQPNTPGKEIPRTFKERVKSASNMTMTGSPKLEEVRSNG